MEYNEELYHFGVKGMKWGVRKDRKKLSKAELNKKNPKYTKSNRAIDRGLYGKGGERRINRRMNKGQSYFRASTTEMIQQVGKGMAVGAAFIASTPEGRYMGKMALQGARNALKNNSVYMNYLRRRYGKGYSWASPANEALKAIGNKIIVDTVTSR